MSYSLVSSKPPQGDVSKGLRLESGGEKISPEKWTKSECFTKRLPKGLKR